MPFHPMDKSKGVVVIHTTGSTISTQARTDLPNPQSNEKGRPLCIVGALIVEPAGIEPASDSAKPGLLRAQSAKSFSQPQRSHGHVADRLSHSKVFTQPR